jgi:hypothetical protein
MVFSFVVVASYPRPDNYDFFVFVSLKREVNGIIVASSELVPDFAIDNFVASPSLRHFFRRFDYILVCKIQPEIAYAVEVANAKRLLVITKEVCPACLALEHD